MLSALATRYFGVIVPLLLGEVPDLAYNVPQWAQERDIKVVYHIYRLSTTLCLAELVHGYISVLSQSTKFLHIVFVTYSYSEISQRTRYRPYFSIASMM